jgi:hypothetical protein
MSHLRGRLRGKAFGLAGFVAVAAPVMAFTPIDLEALTHLERGRWQIRDTESGTALSVCLGDPIVLVQLEHRGVSCGREVLASEAGGGTIQYTCPGRGFGHTSIRVETPRLARIDTQGLVDGRPFAYRAEARKVGSC